MNELKKKIIVIEESPLGSNILETIAEETKPIGKTQFHRRSKHKYTQLLELSNKWKDKLKIVHYPSNDFVNVFIHAGIHESRFVMKLEDLDSLLSAIGVIIITCKKNRILISENSRKNETSLSHDSLSSNLDYSVQEKLEENRKKT